MKSARGERVKERKRRKGLKKSDKESHTGETRGGGREEKVSAFSASFFFFFFAL